MAHITLIDLKTDLPMPILPFLTLSLSCILKQITIKPLYFKAHLIRIPVFFEYIVHF